MRRNLTYPLNWGGGPNSIAIVTLLKDGVTRLFLLCKVRAEGSVDLACIGRRYICICRRKHRRSSLRRAEQFWSKILSLHWTCVDFAGVGVKKVESASDRGHFYEYVDLLTGERIDLILEKALEPFCVFVIPCRELGNHRVAVKSRVKHAKLWLHPVDLSPNVSVDILRNILHSDDNILPDLACPRIPPLNAILLRLFGLCLPPIFIDLLLALNDSMLNVLYLLDLIGKMIFGRRVLVVLLLVYRVYVLVYWV